MKDKKRSNKTILFNSFCELKNKGLNGSQQACWMHIWNFVNSNTCVGFPSQDLLSERMGYHRTQINRLIKKLHNLGFLEILKSKKNNKYRLCIPIKKEQECTPKEVMEQPELKPEISPEIKKVINDNWMDESDEQLKKIYPNIDAFYSAKQD